MNSKLIITAILAIGIGLAAGYFIFGNKNNSDMGTHHHPETANTSSTSAEIWTCSMHPQIRQNEPGDCAICGMDLIPLEENSSSDPLVLEMTAESVKLANIQTTLVGETNQAASKNTIQLSGKVQADERLASSQVAHIPGRIEKLFVSFTGEQVNKGQKIATIYSPQLITAQRELLEALKLQDLNPGLIDAARNKLRYWKIPASTIEGIEQNGTIQETFTVFADETGIITNKRVAVGDYLNQGEALFELMNLNKVWVLFDVYEEDLASIKVGDKIEFTTPTHANKTFSTRITFVAPIINPKTRVASIRTEINNSGGMLKPDMLVYGTLQKKIRTSVKLTVPKSSVMWTGKRSVVYVKLPDMEIPSFQYREIELGESIGNNYQVLTGLDNGDEVVTNGSFTIDAAAQLNNQTSMMNKEVDVKKVSSYEMLPDYTENTPMAFKEQLAQLSNAYLLLKDALVATDSEQAITTSKGVAEAIALVDMKLVVGEAHLYWMKQLKAIQEHNEQIMNSSDVEEQRQQFDFLSQALIQTVKVFGLPNETLYVQHCPMANDNEGADWLSNEQEIRNPYFGDKMMRCGLVKTTIDPSFKNPSVSN